jgi:hypothetical protein
LIFLKKSHSKEGRGKREEGRGKREGISYNSRCLSEDSIYMNI